MRTLPEKGECAKVKIFRNILCIVLSLCALLSFSFFGGTYAWIRVGHAVTVDTEIGVLNLDFNSSGDFKTENDIDTTDSDGDKIIIPGTNLLNGTVSCVNHSTIPIEIRVQVTYTKNVLNSAGSGVDSTTDLVYSSNDVVYSGNTGMSDDLTVNLSSGISWSFSNGYWYSGNIDPPKNATTDTTLNPEDETTGATLNLIDSIYYSDAHQNAYSGRTVTVKFVIQARQSAHMEWSDWKTGYTAAAIKIL